MNTYILHYGQKVGDIRISNIGNGSYFDVYVEGGKITGIDKSWIEIVEDKTYELNDSTEVYTKEMAIEKTKNILKELGSEEIPRFKSCELVLCKNSEGYLSEAWEVSYEGMVFHVDVKNGDTL